jgi:hypothetical protein
MQDIPLHALITKINNYSKHLIGFLEGIFAIKEGGSCKIAQL